MLCAALCLTLASTMSPPGNVVLVVVDDLGWADFGCMPGSSRDTPAIDALRRRGALFTQATANGPNCAPARASLMTGQWTPRHGVYTVGSSKRGNRELHTCDPPPNRTSLRPEAVTIAERLRNAGMRTVHVGKWHLGNDPRDQGFDVNIGGTAKGHPKSHFSPYSNPRLTDGPDRECLSDRLVDEAIAQLQLGDERPTFLHLAFYDVHTPIQADPDCRRNTLERHEDWSKRDANYDCMVRRTDAALGRLLDHLDDDALIIVCSDHGGVATLAQQGELRGTKGQLLEGGIRTPLIVAGPTVVPGSTHAAPVSLHDIAPTIHDWCGLQPAPAHDGHSLVDLLQGSTTAAPSPAQYWHFPCYLEAAGGVSGPWRSTPVSVIRVGDWKLTEFLDDRRMELYNLDSDPGETTNLAGARPAIRDSLALLLHAWRHRVEAPMPTAKASS